MAGDAVLRRHYWFWAEGYDSAGNLNSHQRLLGMHLVRNPHLILLILTLSSPNPHLVLTLSLPNHHPILIILTQHLILTSSSPNHHLILTSSSPHPARQASVAVAIWCWI